MTGHQDDGTGEQIRDEESRLVLPSDALLDLGGERLPRSADEIVAHCEELLAVIRDTRKKGFWYRIVCSVRPRARPHSMAQDECSSRRRRRTDRPWRYSCIGSLEGDEASTVEHNCHAGRAR